MIQVVYLLFFVLAGAVVLLFLMGANKNKSVEEQELEDIEQMKALREYRNNDKH